MKRYTNIEGYEVDLDLDPGTADLRAREFPSVEVAHG